MPRRYPKAPRRRYPRRYPRRRTYGRKRFSRKRFARSNRNYTAINTTTIGKNTRVKFTYTKEWTADVIGLTNQWADIAFPRGGVLYSYPQAGAKPSITFSGSHFCTPLGSYSAIPLTEDYPSGLVEWASFYDEAICFGSSISIQIQPSGGAAALNLVNLRWVLLPVAAIDYTDVIRPSSGSVRTQYDALDYQDIASYPGAKSGYVKTAMANTTYIKAFRKTKHMLGVKDIRDNQSQLTMTLPKSTDLTLGSNATPPTNQAVNGWVWYFRVFPMNSTDSDNVMFSVRINYYTQLQSRGIILQENTAI